ncbi:MAG: ABC transporter ATP-binding protein [Chloroflexota bacterium]
MANSPDVIETPVGRAEQRAPNTSFLKLQSITKHYNSIPALHNVDLSIEEGSIVCLLGPSGCGKTTLLRVIAGLEQADSGTISFTGKTINHIPAHRRGFGLMFQEYALFPHRNVAENIAFGLRMHHVPRPQIDTRVTEMLELVGLAGYERRRVYELSGGERQRVALARSLAPSPPVLMLDEPLGALDRALRERLLDELRDILKQVGVTGMYVTHDQTEAFAIADWLVLMQAGQIEQQGTPTEVYRHPQSTFAARFLGLHNLVPARIETVTDHSLTCETPLGILQVAAQTTTLQRDQQVWLVVRPEATKVVADTTAPNTFPVQITERSFRGSRTRLTVQHTSGQTLVFELPDGALLNKTTDLFIQLDATTLSVIPV